MKKYTLLLLFFVLLAIPRVFAQTGLNGINYQAVARNTNGTVLANQLVKVKISIFGGAANGILQYQENHSLNTNQLGLFTLQIGKGTPITGTLAGVPWQNTNQYLKIELAVGSNAYSDLGTTQLMSVPYALFAANSNPGAIGPQGLQGPAGPTGAVGATGANGTAGVPGLKGDKGDTGAQGLSGAVGANGTNGVAGLKGDKGDQGIQGIAGPTGTNGTPGIKGDKGDPGDITTSAAGGDLSGNYPNPKVEKIQGISVVATIPIAGQYLKFDGTSWTPSAMASGAAFTLPYTSVETNANPLFSITNQGNGTTIASRNEGNGFAIDAKATTAGVALRAESNTGNGIQVKSNTAVGAYVESNSGIAGIFLNNSNNNTINATNLGSGAGIKSITNDGVAIVAESTSATNPTISTKNNNVSGIALKTEGKVQLTGIGEGLNKILTSDAIGNASWQNLPAVTPTSKVMSISGVALVSLTSNAIVRPNVLGILWTGLAEETSISEALYAPVSLPNGATITNLKVIFSSNIPVKCTLSLIRNAFSGGNVDVVPAPNVAAVSLTGPIGDLAGTANTNLNHVVANAGASYYISVTSEGYNSVASPLAKVWPGSGNFKIGWIEITYTN